MKTGHILKRQTTTTMTQTATTAQQPRFKALSRFTLQKQKTGVQMPEHAITRSTELADLLSKLYEVEADHYREHFFALYLSRANKVIGYTLISSGGITGTVADPTIIFAHAVQTLCKSIVIAHNHPSGSIQPSRADEEITAKIRQAAAYFDMKVLDHLIVTEEPTQYYSFADEGAL